MFQFAKDKTQRGLTEDDKANVTLLQMAMDDVSDTEADPLGAKVPYEDPNPMLSNCSGI